LRLRLQGAGADPASAVLLIAWVCCMATVFVMLNLGLK